MSGEFIAFLEQEGIIHETSAPQTPQQNGVAECMNQTLLGGARSMLHHAGMMKGFWSKAINTAAHILNRAPRQAFDWKTPYELMFSRKPEVSYM
jgi:IS30 family transposase